MLPLPVTRRAPATALVAASLVAVFVGGGLGLEPLRPAQVLADPTGAGHTLLTCAGLHVGLPHLVGNLVYLAASGSAVERAVGARRMLAVLLLAALAASLAHLSAGETAAMVGASGGIAGLLGAQLALEPRRRIPVVNVLLVGGLVLRVPTFLVAFLWLAVQVATVALGDPTTAVWAHLGGFVAGLVLGRVLAEPEDDTDGG